jgi:hypothetical protein
MADSLASHRGFFGQSRELDLMSHQICEQQTTCPSMKQSQKSSLATKGTALAMTVLAMQANATIATERKTQFDADSETIGIDNRCSGCISHVRDNFVGELRRTDRVVKGFAATKSTNVQVGTLR